LKLQISIDGKMYEAEVEVLEEDAAPRPANHAPRQSSAVIAQPKATAPVQAAAAEAIGDESKVSRSPVTGIVIKVNVAPGQAIHPNDSLMVLEAMKMETNVAAHGAGTVKSVRVAAGDSVRMGQVVVEFE
jgi:methylmalonyl-CoA carboxyltransferase small subunit